jgi:hypothetical protein
MMLAYCQAKQIDFGSVRFLHDGERLSPESTAASRKMKDGDVLQAFQEQQGGNGQIQDLQLKQGPGEHDQLEISVNIEGEDSPFTFKIGRTVLLGELMGNINNIYHYKQVC